MICLLYNCSTGHYDAGVINSWPLATKTWPLEQKSAPIYIHKVAIKNCSIQTTSKQQLLLLLQHPASICGPHNCPSNARAVPHLAAAAAVKIVQCRVGIRSQQAPEVAWPVTNARRKLALNGWRKAKWFWRRVLFFFTSTLLVLLLLQLASSLKSPPSGLAASPRDLPSDMELNAKHYAPLLVSH